MSCDICTQRARQAAVIDSHRPDDLCVYDRQPHALADGEGRRGASPSHPPCRGCDLYVGRTPAFILARNLLQPVSTERADSSNASAIYRLPSKHFPMIVGRSFTPDIITVCPAAL